MHAGVEASQLASAYSCCPGAVPRHRRDDVRSHDDISLADLEVMKRSTWT